MHETCSGNVVRASEGELAAAMVDDISQIIRWNYLQNGGGDMASSYRAGQCLTRVTCAEWRRYETRPSVRRQERGVFPPSRPRPPEDPLSAAPYTGDSTRNGRSKPGVVNQKIGKCQRTKPRSSLTSADVRCDNRAANVEASSGYPL